MFSHVKLTPSFDIEASLRVITTLKNTKEKNHTNEYSLVMKEKTPLFLFLIAFPLENLNYKSCLYLFNIYLNLFQS